MDAVATGRWDQTGNDHLRTHAASCLVCRDLASVAQAMSEDRARANNEASVPPSAAAWWRAQLRARREGMETATRPMRVVHMLAAVSLASIALAVIVAVWPTLWSAIEMDTLVALASEYALPLGLVAGASLIAAPLAVYFVLLDD